MPGKHPDSWQTCTIFFTDCLPILCISFSSCVCAIYRMLQPDEYLAGTFPGFYFRVPQCRQHHGEAAYALEVLKQAFSRLRKPIFLNPQVYFSTLQNERFTRFSSNGLGSEMGELMPACGGGGEWPQEQGRPLSHREVGRCRVWRRKVGATLS